MTNLVERGQGTNHSKLSMDMVRDQIPDGWGRNPGTAAKPFPAQLCEGAACRRALPRPPCRLQALEQPVHGVLTYSGAQGRHEQSLFPESPPPPSAGKGSVLHLGQGSACYSVPALTQMVQQLCQLPPKTPRTFCTQTAFERPWQ